MESVGELGGKARSRRSRTSVRELCASECRCTPFTVATMRRNWCDCDPLANAGGKWRHNAAGASTPTRTRSMRSCSRCAASRKAAASSLTKVGLGKTIEAGLVVAQLLAEGATRVLIVVPRPLLGQWQHELYTLFGIEAVEAADAAIDVGGAGVFLAGREYVGGNKGFARLSGSPPFDLCLIDEAHEVFAGIHRRFDRDGVYDEDSRFARTAHRMREVIGASPVVLLTATPIQNSLAELWGLVQYVDPTGTLLGTKPVEEHVDGRDEQPRDETSIEQSIARLEAEVREREGLRQQLEHAVAGEEREVASRRQVLAEKQAEQRKAQDAGDWRQVLAGARDEGDRLRREIEAVDAELVKIRIEATTEVEQARRALADLDAEEYRARETLRETTERWTTARDELARLQGEAAELRATTQDEDIEAARGLRDRSTRSVRSGWPARRTPRPPLPPAFGSWRCSSAPPRARWNRSAGSTSRNGPARRGKPSPPWRGYRHHSCSDTR